MDEGSQTVSQEILDAVRGGDQGASRTLIDMLYPQVISIVRNHLPRSETEEDIVQDVFMKVFAKIDSYRGRQPFSHWVSRITLNTCRDWLRRGQVRPAVSWTDLHPDQAELLERTLAGNEPAPDENPALLRDFLDQLISTLNPREQIVIRLLDLEERSVQDVSDLPGWGVSKVKVTAMRARRKLAEQMRRLDPDAKPES